MSDIGALLANILSRGIGGYQAGRQINADRRRQNFLDRLRMAQFEREGDRRQQDVDWREDQAEGDVDWRNRRAVAGDFWRIFEGVEDFRKEKRGYQHDIDMANLYKNLGRYDKVSVDPTIAENRQLEKRAKMGRLIDAIIGRQSERERQELAPFVDRDQYDYAENFAIDQPPTITEGGWGFLSKNKELVNPAYQPSQEFLFWNPGNQAARDSAAVLGGLLPNMDAPAKPQPMFSAMDSPRNNVVKELVKEFGQAEWRAASPEMREKAIAKKMKEMGY
jgi:hypothetical protein